MVRDDNPRRRNVLKKIGAASLASGIGLSELTNPAVARTISPDDTGSVADSEWNTFEDYSNSQYTDSSTSSINPSPDEIATGDVAFNMPNPVKLGFDACAQLSNGNQLCLSNFSVGEISEVDCANRELSQFGIGIESLVLQPEGTYEVSWSAKAWFGFDSNGCIWVGTSAGWENSCTSVDCPDFPDYTVTLDDVKDTAWNIGEDMAAEVYYKLNQPSAIAPGSEGGTALAAVCAFVAFLIVAPPTGLPG